MHKQWQKWGDLDNQETIAKFGGLLAGMGISGELITPLVVSVTVIVLHIGVKAFCEEYGDRQSTV